MPARISGSAQGTGLPAVPRASAAAQLRAPGGADRAQGEARPRLRSGSARAGVPALRCSHRALQRCHVRQPGHHLRHLLSGHGAVPGDRPPPGAAEPRPLHGCGLPVPLGGGQRHPRLRHRPRQAPHDRLRTQHRAARASSGGARHRRPQRHAHAPAVRRARVASQGRRHRPRDGAASSRAVGSTVTVDLVGPPKLPVPLPPYARYHGLLSRKKPAEDALLRRLFQRRHAPLRAFPCRGLRPRLRRGGSVRAAGGHHGRWRPA